MRNILDLSFAGSGESKMGSRPTHRHDLDESEGEVIEFSVWHDAALR